MDRMAHPLFSYGHTLVAPFRALAWNESVDFGPDDREAVRKQLNAAESFRQQGELQSRSAYLWRRPDRPEAP